MTIRLARRGSSSNKAFVQQHCFSSASIFYNNKFDCSFFFACEVLSRWIFFALQSFFPLYWFRFLPLVSCSTFLLNFFPATVSLPSERRNALSARLSLWVPFEYRNSIPMDNLPYPLRTLRNGCHSISLACQDWLQDSMAGSSNARALTSLILLHDNVFIISLFSRTIVLLSVGRRTTR